MQRIAGYKAVDDHVRSGMRVGLGTGSTAWFAVERVGQRLKEGDLVDILCVPTSQRTREQAESLGIPLATLDTCSELDVAVAPLPLTLATMTRTCRPLSSVGRSMAQMPWTVTLRSSKAAAGAYTTLQCDNRAYLGGRAMHREKLVALSAAKFVVRPDPCGAAQSGVSGDCGPI